MTNFKPCAVFDCVNSRGKRLLYCEKHYRRQLRHGSINTVNKRGRKPAA